MTEVLGKGFHAVSDLFEFGPIGAFQINTSGFAASERAIKRAVRNVKNVKDVEVPKFSMEELLKEKHMLNIMLGVDKAASEAEAGEAQERRDFILHNNALGKEEDFAEEVKAILAIVQEQIDVAAAKAANTKKLELKVEEAKQLPYIKVNGDQVEVVTEKLNMESITENIGAAFHEFDVETDDDKQLLRCFILGFLNHNDLVNQEDIKKIVTTDEDQQLIIGISNWMDSAEAGYIYNAGKSVVVDASIVLELKKFLEWEAGYIQDKINKVHVAAIQSGFKQILKNLEELKEEIEPVIEVTDDNVIPKSGYTDSEKQEIVARLNQEFDSIMKDHKIEGMMTYKFNIIGDIAELLVADPNFTAAPSRYRIDIGTIIGNGTNLIYYAQDATDGLMKDIYINVSRRPEIVKHIIDTVGYTMTSEEIQEALTDTFANKQIYYYVDMGSFAKHISGLKPNKLRRLEQRLGAIANVLGNDNDVPAARVRLKSWGNESIFTLVSDGDCRSPLAMKNNTCMEIADGLELKIHGNDIDVKFINKDGKPATAKFTITK